jgi:hypothetical protein
METSIRFRRRIPPESRLSHPDFHENPPRNRGQNEPRRAFSSTAASTTNGVLTKSGLLGIIFENQMNPLEPLPDFSRITADRRICPEKHAISGEFTRVSLRMDWKNRIFLPFSVSEI